MFAKSLRIVLRVLRVTLLGLAAVLALAVLAWLPFNLRDDQKRPTPPALQLAAPSLPDDRNAAFVIHALLAEAGRDPAATGRAVWDTERAFAALPAAQRASDAADARAQKVQALRGKAIAAPKGPPLSCTGKRDTCDSEWLAQADALATQRAAYGPLVERCEALARPDTEFEELLPPGNLLEAPLMSFVGVADCIRWFRSGAIVALAGKRADDALAPLERAERLQRMMWGGARTLVGHMVAARVGRATFDTMATAALREPALAGPLAAKLAAPVDTRATARRWMQVEAQFISGAVDLAATSAVLGLSDMSLGGMGRLGDWLTGHGVGFLKERTRQKFEDAWLKRIAWLEGDWPSILAAAAAEQREAQGRDPVDNLRWSNTIGELLYEVASPTQWGSYLARQADYELHREATALVLALQSQRVAAAQRASAASQLPGLSAALKSRISWSADALVLTVRPWQSEPPGIGFDAARDGITFRWPQ